MRGITKAEKEEDVGFAKERYDNMKKTWEEEITLVYESQIEQAKQKPNDEEVEMIRRWYEEQTENKLPVTSPARSIQEDHSPDVPNRTKSQGRDLFSRAHVISNSSLIDGPNCLIIPFLILLA